MTAATERLSNNWWVFLLQGIAVLILGILLITNPAVTVATLVIFLGIYWLIDGIFSLVSIFTKTSNLHWGWLLARGILGILAGIYVVRHPLLASLLVPTVLIIILAVQGLIMGVIGIIQAFKGDGWGTGVLGAINILFGIILLSSPLLAAWILPLVIGIFGIIGGIALIFFAFKVRKATA